MKTPSAPEPIKVSSWPRDDVRYSDDVETWGVAQVRGPGEAQVARLTLGDYGVTLLDFEAGTVFSVQLTARHGADMYEQTLRFRATLDDDDVDHYAIGPGLTTERGRWGRRTHSGFEFGVLVMGAVQAEDE